MTFDLSFPARLDRALIAAAALHLVLGGVTAALLLTETRPILGVHPALKPMKFGLTIAVFLFTMAVVLPKLSIAEPWRRVAAWALASTMAAEMAPILVQSLRGTTSHFNTQTSLDAALWRVMIGAIVVATLVMFALAAVATLRPLIESDGRPTDPLTATAWRVGLWMFMLTAWTGFRMGGRLSHSVGGVDGGAGLPLVNWSTTHGDLRVAHFVSMHGLQVLPVAAALLLRLPIPDGLRWLALGSAGAGLLGATLATARQALSSRPVW